MTQKRNPNRPTARAVNNAPYDRAMARLGWALLQLRPAIDEVLSLDPNGYQADVRPAYPDDPFPDDCWRTAFGESIMLDGILEHVLGSYQYTFVGGLRAFIENVGVTLEDADDPTFVESHP